MATLKELPLPNVCWLGDSFADQFRWQNGVSPAHKRPDVVDTDAFGSNEFVDFIRQICGLHPPDQKQRLFLARYWFGHSSGGCRVARVMMEAPPTSLARGARGHQLSQSRQDQFLGIGNESWECVEAISADHYRKTQQVPVVMNEFVRRQNQAWIRTTRRTSAYAIQQLNRSK